METHYVLFVSLVLILHLIQAQDPTGFINLDCGLSIHASPYIDSTTQLSYISDEGLVQSEKTGQITKDLEPRHKKSLWTLRYFPDGKRNCYNVNVTKDKNYLVTASFLYGNYDGFNDIPSFDLYFGSNMWATVNVTETVEEVIHMTRSDSLQICLVKTGTSIPYINELKLRPLKDKTYLAQDGSFNCLGRLYFSNSIRGIQYPDDIYDRIWSNYFLEEKWKQLTTSLRVNTFQNYSIPQGVMSTAATPISLNTTTLEISWTLRPPTSQFYMFLHFAELEKLQGNDTREFSLTLNGNVIFESYSPRFLTTETLRNTKPNQCTEGKCSLGLVKTTGSTLPPLINGFEVLTVIDFSQLGTNGDEVDAIKNIQSTYGLSRINWQGDPCLPQEFMWDGLKCKHSNTSTPMPSIITSLNLSSSGLMGIIAPTIQNLTNLQELDLSNNNLTGAIPEFLAEMKSLLVINLSGNNLSGSIPQKLLQNNGLKFNFEGNPQLHCTVGSCLNKAGEDGKSKATIIASVLSSFAFLLIIASILFFLYKKKRFSPSEEDPTLRMLPSDDRSCEPEIIAKNKRFTYLEVLTMTNHFEKVLGKGGFGIVYYGLVNGNKQVAVKVLSHSSSQGYKQFIAEVELLLRVHHKNLVGLVGYCDEGENLALIYEYMANGDLDEHMSGKRGGSVLDWGTRLKIAVESAQGLEYLHNGCKPVMVHRDIKTTNILLNEHFQAKLADFGLSRSFPTEGDTHVSTVVAGTIGYLDPEYYRTNWLSEKSDVYSFGIVLLVVITNKPVIDPNREKRHIAEWVGQMLTKGDIKSIVDPTLNEDYESNTVWKVVELAMSCLNPSSVKRPTMSHIVFDLNECLESENLRKGGSREMESQSSIESGLVYGTEVNPMAR